MNLAPGFRPPPPGGAGGVAMENLEKQLICPVCLEMFSKPVVILPCQHNLCRKCASDVFQASSPVWQTRGSSGGTAGGGRFRCPSCRHEVVLDRHGVFGLQRNLLVENIIDIYRQQESSRPASSKQQQLMCEEHEDERINIYCLSCETPSCSMCKVFGRHRGCEVAPLSSVYVRQKTELSDAIALLVAANDHVQAAISQLEETCHTLQVNGQTQRERLSVNFDELVGVLEERKQQLVGGISREQDERLKQARSLLQRHRQHLEGTAALLEEAIHTMEEPHRALFIMRAESILEKMAAMARSSNVERLELGYESMSHFVLDTDDLAEILKNIDFCGGEDEDEDDEAERDEDL